MGQRTTWIVQQNYSVTSPTINLLTEALADADYPVRRVHVVPFSEELPQMPGEVEFPFILFGLTTLIKNAVADPKWRQGIFFDAEKFAPCAYQDILGDLLLNSDMRVCTARELSQVDFGLDEKIFVRPNDDFKAFGGQVMTMGEYLDWYNLFKDADDMSISRDTLMVYAAPKPIRREFRVHLVSGRVVGLSQYQPTAQAVLPFDVAEFAEHVAAHYSPADAFVLDIADTADGLRVLEYNCINGAGFYLANVRTIVRALSIFQEGKA